MGWKASPYIRDLAHHPTHASLYWQAVWSSPWGFVGMGGSGGGYGTIDAYDVRAGSAVSTSSASGAVEGARVRNYANADRQGPVHDRVRWPPLALTPCASVAS